jgi:aspartyl-tRNA(Asn)/glutamyl-tRNA(Gln) amidotransferase subunit C
MADLLTSADVDRIAALAHLALSGEERDRFAHQLAGILAYARQVQDVDTTGVPPTTHTLVPEGRLRADEPAVSLPRDQALAAAPDAARDAGFFRVPKVIG